MRIYLLLGHPETASFNGALADAYEKAARARGHELRRQNLGELAFDPVLRPGAVQPLEPDLVTAQQNLLWCETWVMFYPVWWGNVPALLKGFLDRVLLPDFAYRPHDDDPLWDRLLTGRTAHLITTSDAPASWLWWRYRNSDVHALRRATLDFCGIKPVRVTRIARVRFLDEVQRKRWLERMAKLV